MHQLAHKGPLHAHTPPSDLKARPGVLTLSLPLTMWPWACPVSSRTCERSSCSSMLGQSAGENSQSLRLACSPNSEPILGLNSGKALLDQASKTRFSQDLVQVPALSTVCRESAMSPPTIGLWSKLFIPILMSILSAYVLTELPSPGLC